MHLRAPARFQANKTAFQNGGASQATITVVQPCAITVGARLRAMERSRECLTTQARLYPSQIASQNGYFPMRCTNPARNGLAMT